MRNFDVVIVAVQGWDFEIGSNAKNIALEFAKNHRVLFVNPPLDLITRIKSNNDRRVKKYNKVIQKKEKSLTKVANNVWNLYPDFVAPSINWIPNPMLHDFLNKYTNQRLASCINNAVMDLNFGPYILFNDNFIFKGMYLKEILRPEKYIYYIRDFLTIQPYFKKHGIRLEPQLIQNADAVVANSTYLMEYAQKYNPKSFYVGQGCELEIFDEDLVKEVPQDIQGLQGPLIGYVGFLTSMRLDINLLFTIASLKPEWNIVLVGPEDRTFKDSALHGLKNIFFLGKKTPDQLPAYIKTFHVCINPQLINQLTIGNYPRKVDEYLAMGKPVVATNTKAMDVFKDHVYLASNAIEFVDFIGLALDDGENITKITRKLFAQSHTWEASVSGIYSAIDEVSKNA